MFNFKSKKTQRIVIGVIVGIICLAMIIPLLSAAFS